MFSFLDPDLLHSPYFVESVEVLAPASPALDREDEILISPTVIFLL